MSRTARCLFALGLSVSLAAACGDDDGDGGTAGSGGSGGRAGAAGTAGTAGTGGAAGAAGGGAGGDAGTGGTNAGNGGGGAGGTNNAGTGGGGTGGTAPEPPDAGPDAADGGDVTDSGPLARVCPDLPDLEDEGDVADLAAAVVPANNQNVGIVRVVFRDNGADVTFIATGADFNFADPQVLCTGSENADCDADVQGLVALEDGGTGDLLEDEVVTFFTPGVNPTAGELALINGLPSDPDSFVFAYIAWGNFTSVAPTVGGGTSLEARADDANVWVTDDRVDVGSDTTIFITEGSLTSEDAYDACTAAP